MQRFIDAGKAVFQTEYVEDWRRRGRRTPHEVLGRVCPRAERQELSVLVKRFVPDRTFHTC